MSKDEVLSYIAMCLTISEITFGRCSCVVAIVFYLNSVPENNYVVNSASNQSPSKSIAAKCLVIQLFRLKMAITTQRVT